MFIYSITLVSVRKFSNVFRTSYSFFIKPLFVYFDSKVTTLSSLLEPTPADVSSVGC